MYVTSKEHTIKISDNLTKVDLIISLLRSENNPVERNHMKRFNNSTNDDSYDDNIKAEINDIRVMLSRLGHIVTKNDKKKIKKELYKIEKSKNFQITKKKSFMIILSN